MVEPALPEPGHVACPVDQRGQGAELRAIVRLATFVAVAHQPGLLQDREMLGDRWLRDPGASLQGPDCLFSFATEVFEQSPPRRIGQYPEENVMPAWQHE